MKIKFLIFSTCLFALSCNSWACSSIDLIRHTNPDGSQGGLKSKRAKVEGSIFLSKQAKICDLSTVVGSVDILDNSVVSGAATIDGSRKKVIISENAQIYGRARVEFGSNISGNSQIFGSARVVNSIVSGDSKVCEGYRIEDRNVSDDYFCSGNSRDSIATVELRNIDQNKMNPKPKRIEINITKVLLSSNSDRVKVFLNHEEVPANLVTVFRNKVIVDSRELINEGLNTVSLEADDEFNKKIVGNEFEFFAGSRQLIIPLSNNFGLYGGLKTKINYTYSEREFEGQGQIGSDSIVIDNIPDIEDSLPFTLQAVGDHVFIYESGNDIKAIESFDSFLIPSFVDNISDFSNGLDSWQVSHPENVSIQTNGSGSNYLSIDVQSDRTITVAKTIELGLDDVLGSITFGLSGSVVVQDETKSSQIILLSTDTKEMLVKEYSINDINRLSGDQDRLDFFKSKKYKQKITLVIRHLSSDTNKMIRAVRADYDPFLKSKRGIQFSPRNFSVHNKYVAYVPNNHQIMDSEDPVSCNDIGYLITNPELHIYQDNISYFSAGSLGPMDWIKSNRIYGHIGFIGIHKENIASNNIKLIVEQNGIKKHTISLTKCGEKIFKDAPFQPSIDGFSMSLQNSNIASYLFNIPASDFYKISTLKGAKVKMYIEAELSSPSAEVIKSEPKNLPVLKVPDITLSQISGTRDNFASIEPNALRTGGDKWILPSYSPYAESILSNSDWKVDDMSKLNGGFFAGHGKHTHIDGRDMDIKFSPFIVENNLKVEFDFKLFDVDDLLWKPALDKIESFLNSLGAGSILNNTISTIRTIYLSGSNFEKNNIIYRRFHNRCITYPGQISRFINLELPNSARSLIKYAVDHHNHLHVRFNEEVNGDVKFIKPIIPNSNLDFSDFLFSLDSNRDLIVELKQDRKSKYLGKRALWRFQDRQGFDDINLGVQFGIIGAIPGLKKIQATQTMPNDNIRYIYLTIVDNATSGCSQNVVEVDITNNAVLFRRILN